MFRKLDELQQRFEQVSEKIVDPSVIQDQNTYQKLTKERSRLLPIVETYHEYKKTCEELEGNKSLLSEKDEELRKLAKEEIPVLEEKKTRLEQQLKIQLLPKDPNDDKNIFLEIRAGTGGDEAALFAADLFRMYSKYAETCRWHLSVMDSNINGVGGFKEVIAQISGESVYSHLKYEAGIHRVQRVPQTESQGRVHTSAVTVAIMPEVEDIDIQIHETDLEIDVFRASGPGGQGVNTTDSAVRITHKPSGLAIVCREERSQIKNKARAMSILKSRLYEIECEKRDSAQRSSRQAMVGSGDRSEKIRTYNYPQNRVTDHRIGLTLHHLDTIMEGKLEEVITALRTHYQTEALKQSS